MLERQDTEDMLLTVEEFDREIEQAVLEKMRNYLCDKLEPERFFPFLQSKKYLDTESCEQIRHAGTTKSRVNKMLDILMKSGQNPLVMLIKGIKRCCPTQKFVAEKLQDEHNKIKEDSENIARREAIVSRTQLFQVSPPPYRPYDRPPDYSIGCSEFSGLTLVSADQKIVGKPCGPVPGYHGDRNVCTPPERDQNMAPAAKTPLNVQPHNEIYATPHGSSECGFGGNISQPYFESHDFPTVVYPTIRDELLSMQDEKAQKFSSDISNHPSLRDQQNQLGKYTNRQSEQSQTHSVKWHRPERSPSEHDASVVSPRRSVSPSPVEDGNTSGAKGSNARPKNLMQMASCQSGSIQPSCFTSSNFGDESTTQNEQRSTTPTPPRGGMNGWPQSPIPKVFRPHPLHNAVGQFSSPLETIPSLEISSVSASENVSSINIRRPPMEHEDISVVKQDQLDDDDDDSSLEISADSDN